MKKIYKRIIFTNMFKNDSIFFIIIIIYAIFLTYIQEYLLCNNIIIKTRVVTFFFDAQCMILCDKTCFILIWGISTCFSVFLLLLLLQYNNLKYSNNTPEILLYTFFLFINLKICLNVTKIYRGRVITGHIYCCFLEFLMNWFTEREKLCALKLLLE